jgi:V/A-type H+-transporting ATPase subunit A
MPVEGYISRVAGPVVEAKSMQHAAMHELVQVGNARLVGEIIRLDGETATIQVYQDTAGLTVNEKVVGTGSPLSVELGPGLVGNVFDGIQRPLETLRDLTGPFIKQTEVVAPLSRTKTWAFTPKLNVGTQVIGGDVVGTVQETNLIEHRIMVPPDVNGKLTSIAKADEYKIDQPIATVQSEGGEVELTLMQKWPVRKSRPYLQRLSPSVPLITGQRVIDTLFPISKGAVPPFLAGLALEKPSPSSSLPNGLMHILSCMWAVGNGATRWWMC